MANERNNWENKPSTATPITAENLNKLEANAKKGADFADVPTDIGLQLLVATSGTIARGAIGAGTSSLVVGSTLPSNLAAAANAGTSTAAARADHVHALPAAATTSVNGLMSSADKTKLDGIATGATANDTDANLKNRANHTGTQAISTITGVVPIAQIPTGTTATTVSLGNHTHAVATTTVAGFMSAADKVKLDGIAVATTATAGLMKKSLGVEDSDATELVTLRNSFNELLANLRAAGIMQ